MAAQAQTTETVVKAEAKWVRMSARKARIVLEHIRGRSVPEARTILAFTQRAAAIEIEKVLRSAVANAETNPLLHWNGDDLIVQAAYADEGPTLKRWQQRARGRASAIMKRTCHITVVLAQAPERNDAGRKRPSSATTETTTPSASAPKAAKRKRSEKKEGAAV
jgi:large subunit ribosomal protein L22